jgi:hypothetical protein
MATKSNHSKKLFLLGSAIALAAVAEVAFAVGGVTPKGKKEVKVLAEANKSAAQIASLKDGEEAEALERSGMFWKVKLKGKTGFVSILDVTRSGEGTNSSFAKAIRNAAQESRGQDENSGVRARSAVMGVRGLDESDKVGNAGSVQPNTQMVYSMEDLKISQKEIDRVGEMVFDEVETRAEKTE